MHDALYENQERLSLALMYELAEDLQLPVKELKDALETRELEAKVKADFMGGVRSGVNGTPCFFINGVRYNGSFEAEALILAINAAK